MGQSAAPDKSGELLTYIKDTFEASQNSKLDALTKSLTKIANDGSDALKAQVEAALADGEACTAKGFGTVNGKCVALPWVVTSTDATCSTENIGALRYSASAGGLQVCSGSKGWGAVASNPLGKSKSSPAPSCKNIRDTGLSTGSGMYWLASPTRLSYCDMSGDACCGKGGEVGDGSSSSLKAPGCFQIQQYFGGLTSAFKRFWLDSGEHFCALRAGAIVEGKVGVAPYADGSSQKTAGYTCQFILDQYPKTITSSESRAGVWSRFVRNPANPLGEPVKFRCTVKNGVATGKPDACCKTKEDAGESCSKMHVALPSMESGVYWVRGTSGVKQVYCDMKVNGGGWTLAGKVYNGDSTRFYGKGRSNPLHTGATFNSGGTSLLETKNKFDALGWQFREIKMTELMVVDGEKPSAWVSASFVTGSHRSLWKRIQEAGGGNPGGLGCSETGTNLKKGNDIVSRIKVKGLGLKCEDDNQRSWKCDDDAVHIGWGMINPSHRNGIGKCGNDGGSDIYAGENTQTPGFVLLFVR